MLTNILTLGSQPLPSSIAPLISQLMNTQRPKYTSNAPDSQIEQAITDTAKILLLIRSHQVSGHEVAKIDPL